MQLLVQYSSELVTAISLFITTLLLLRFTANRVKQLPEEEKSLGRPLWVVSIGIFLLGLASFLNYEHALSPSTELETIYYLVVVLGAGIIAIAATMILGWKKGQAFPIVIMGIIAVVAMLEQAGFGILGAYSGEFVAIFAGILFGIPFFLFSYLTVKTKRITSFGFAVLTLTYPFFLAMTSFTAPEIVAIILAIRLYGPALVITALILPKAVINAELLVYTMTVSSLLYFMSYVLVSPIVGDLLSLIAVTFLAIGSVLGIGTSAYTFTRWEQSRSQTTFTLGLFFFVSGFGFLVVALVHVEFIVGINAEYVALILGLMSPMILNLSAILALDWKRILLLPVVIFSAPMVLILMNWPAGVPSDALPMRPLFMGVTGILQTIIPLGLYGLLWWRMKKSAAPGRNRALFLTLGIILLIFGTAGGATTSILSSTALLGAFALWWLGVTGRADTLLKTTS